MRAKAHFHVRRLKGSVIFMSIPARFTVVGLKFTRMGADTTLNCDLDKILSETEVDIRFLNGEQRVFLDGCDVSDEIRTPAASKMASAVSAKPQVRAFLLEMQRRLAENSNVLMDGRDIGTVVLPNATVKIFLTASAEVRAERRYKELCEKGQTVTYEQIYGDMVKRDYDDMHRETAPLKQAEDAVLADTTSLDFEQSLQLILDIVKKGIAEK